MKEPKMIEVENITKKFGKTVAADDVSFTVKDGEFLTLLGPSGCGKSTTLRCIAGLEIPDDGRIAITGETVYSKKDKINVPSEKRQLGMVFQSYAVWPHRTIFENIAFPLKIRKFSKEDIKKEVKKTIEKVKLTGLENRYPSELSGGQQQRVALARSLVYNPKVLLLDEPLSNLDAKLREEMRFELKELQKQIGITTVYVTHDQLEAIVMSDRIVVMFNGKVVETGNPWDVYSNPRNQLVANFIGSATALCGEISHIDSGLELTLVITNHQKEVWCKKKSQSTDAKKVTIFIRPEDVFLYKSKPSGKNVWKGKILSKIFEGSRINFIVALDEDVIRSTTLPSALAAQFEERDTVYVQVEPNRCLVFPYNEQAT